MINSYLLLWQQNHVTGPHAGSVRLASSGEMWTMTISYLAPKSVFACGWVQAAACVSGRPLSAHIFSKVVMDIGTFARLGATPFTYQ